MYAETVICEILMLRFRNIGGMRYANYVAFSQLRRNTLYALWHVQYM